MLVSGPIVKIFLERKKKIPAVYEIYQHTDADLYLFLSKEIASHGSFNLEHTKKISHDDLNNWISEQQWPGDNGSYEQDRWLEGIKSVLQSKQEKERKDFWWNIFLIGHGDFESTICGLSVEDFAKVVRFLAEPTQNVFFFYYDTCYGGGEHLVEPYKKMEDFTSVLPPLPFIVVSGATRSEVSHFYRINYPALFVRLNELLNFFFFLKE